MVCLQNWISFLLLSSCLYDMFLCWLEFYSNKNIKQQSVLPLQPLCLSQSLGQAVSENLFKLNTSQWLQEKKTAEKLCNCQINLRRNWSGRQYFSSFYWSGPLLAVCTHSSSVKGMRIYLNSILSADCRWCEATSIRNHYSKKALQYYSNLENNPNQRYRGYCL